MLANWARKVISILSWQVGKLGTWNIWPWTCQKSTAACWCTPLDSRRWHEGTYAARNQYDFHFQLRLCSLQLFTSHYWLKCKCTDQRRPAHERSWCCKVNFWSILSMLHQEECRPSDSSSGVDLTAAVQKDPVTNELVLEGGALVRPTPAYNGIF